MTWNKCISCKRYLPPRYYGRGVLQCTSCTRHWALVRKWETERIETDDGLWSALDRIEEIWASELDTPLGRELSWLLDRVVEYEGRTLPPPWGNASADASADASDPSTTAVSPAS